MARGSGRAGGGGAAEGEAEHGVAFELGGAIVAVGEFGLPLGVEAEEAHSARRRWSDLSLLAER